jgi:formamidopyrimidine-DNA glycosylase
VPELPEVETIARDLEDAVRGATIASVHVDRADVLREYSPRAFARRLAGATLHRFWRRGKYVIADLSTGDRIVVSPRFTGSLLVEHDHDAGTAADYTAVRFDLTDGRRLRYRDVRRLGTVTLMPPPRFDAWIATLGPEPFDPSLTPERFAATVRSSSRAIKTILMDQRRIAGIGNIYANEALWRARIRPSRRGRTLTRDACARLLLEARAVLGAAVEQRGTSFRDYRDPHGGRGGFLGLAQVYAREGRPCTRCGTVLKSSHALEGRITVWCTTCQR